MLFALVIFLGLSRASGNIDLRACDDMLDSLILAVAPVCDK